MAIIVFWRVKTPLWIPILLAMVSLSHHEYYVTSEKTRTPTSFDTDEVEISTRSTTTRSHLNDQVLNYPEMKTSSESGETSILSNDVREDVKINIATDKTKQLNSKWTSSNYRDVYKTAHLYNQESEESNFELISNQNKQNSYSHQNRNMETNGRMNHKLNKPLPDSPLSTSQQPPPPPSTSTTSNKSSKADTPPSKSTPNLYSIKGHHNDPPPSQAGTPITPPVYPNKATKFPGAPYQPIYPSPHDLDRGWRPIQHGGESGSNKEMNAIHAMSDNTTKRESEFQSDTSLSLPTTIDIDETRDHNDENYISSSTSRIRRTISGRLQTRNGEMANAISENKRPVNHKTLKTMGNKNTGERQFSNAGSYRETMMRNYVNHVNHDQDNDGNKSNQNANNLDTVSGNFSSQVISRSSSFSIPSSDFDPKTSRLHSSKNRTMPSHSGSDYFENDNFLNGRWHPSSSSNQNDNNHHHNHPHNYHYRHYHHRHRRRHRRQLQTGSRSRRPPRPGQRSRTRTSPFGRKFGSRLGRPTTNIRRGRNNITATGEEVSLKVVVHTSLHRNYERILNGTIDTLMSSREYRMLWKHISPSGSLVRLRTDMPKDILQAFCSEILRSNTTTVVHLMNPFYHRRHWESAGYVDRLLATLNVPRISWGPEYIGAMDKKESDTQELNISPTLHHQAEALIALLAYYKWPYFAVVYTRVPGYDTFITSIKIALEDHSKGIKKGTGNSRVGGHWKHTVEHRLDLLATVEMTNTSDTARTLADLKYLQHTDARVVILFCKESQTLDLLTHASKLGMLGREYLWILTFEAVNKNKEQNARYLPLGLLGLQYSYRDLAMEQAISTAVRVWLDGLRQAVLSTSATSSGTPKGLPWKLPALQCKPNSTLEWKSGHELYKFMHQSSLTDINFNEAGQLKTTNISIYNVQYKRGGRYNGNKWMEIGQWTKQGLFMKQITWPGGATSPPSGKPQRHFLRIVTREEPPFVEYRDLNSNGSCDMFSSPCSIYRRDANESRLSSNTTQKCCTGLSIEILRKLAFALDFEFKLYEVPDFQWGTKMPNGEWNGIVGELRAGHADMGVASMTIDEDKSGAVNFSVPYMETGITFIVAIREGAVSATAFLEPYDYPSWCLILVCSVHVTGASIFLFEWLSPDGMDHGKRGTSEHRFSLFRAFWLMWAMLFGAAVTTDSPRGVSSKFLSNIWALFALVFTASYTANLAAFMITKEEYYELSGMHDPRLLNPYSVNPPFRFATIPNGTAESNIKKNNPKMYKYMSKFSQISVEHAIDALKSQELQAFVYDASVLRYKEGKDEDCQLITVGNWYATTGYGVSFPLGSPWLDRVNKVILKLQSEGEMDRLKEFWLAGACHTKRKKTNSNKGIGNGVSSATLGILNFTSAFIFLLAGTGLAILVFVLEFWFTWFGRHKLKSCSNKDWCHLISLSMGMTLSFRDSVREAMEAHRKSHAKQCKSVVCETKLWKAHYELRQARTEIGKLQIELDRLTVQDPDAEASTSSGVRENDNSIQGDDDDQIHKDLSRTDEKSIPLTPLSSHRPEPTHNNHHHTHKQTHDREPKASTAAPTRNEPHLAQIHHNNSNLKNGDVTKVVSQSDWPSYFLNDDDDDDEDEEKSVRVTLL